MNEECLGFIVYVWCRAKKRVVKRAVRVINGSSKIIGNNEKG